MGSISSYFPAGLKAGELNVVPPFQKESRVHNTGEVILERWRKIAGLDQHVNLITEQAEEPNRGPEIEEPVEGVWGGDPDDEGRNLVEPLDHVKSGGVDPETDAPRHLPDAGPVLSNESKGRLQVYRSTNDLGRVCKLPPILFERYFDAWVCGNQTKAIDLLEEHLDARYPGWIDYEWR